MVLKTRAAKPTDAQGILDIYAPIVEQTAISFETEVPDEATIGERIKSYSDSHAYLVSEDEDRILGYAYGSSFRPREAYRNSVEVTVYVHPQARGHGIAKNLYTALFGKLLEKQFHTALAGIALPNEASVALHRVLGFEPVGIFRDVGFKLGQWHDVQWWQKPLIENDRK